MKDIWRDSTLDSCRHHGKASLMPFVVKNGKTLKTTSNSSMTHLNTEYTPYIKHLCLLTL